MTNYEIRLLVDIVAWSFVGSVVLWQWLRIRRLDRDLADANRYREEDKRIFPVLKSWKADDGTHSWVSFDSGETWYDALRIDRDGEFTGYKLCGLADQEELSRVLGMRKLLEHVQKHGTITEMDDEARQVLEAAGFTVTVRPNSD